MQHAAIALAAHSPEACTPSPSERRLRPDLRAAVRDRAFALAFQTRRRMSDGMSCGAEIQLRWPSRAHGVVGASVLMPLAEECGLASQILAWTLNSACTTAAAWPDGAVSVSAPAAAAQDGSVLILASEALTEAALPPHRLEILLPDQTTRSDDTETLLALSALRDHGVGVALEDFGRTAACLVKLKRLPLTAVKLDRSLLRDMMCDRSAASMVRATIDFAHALDMQVLAPWVDTDQQRDFLRRVGCDVLLDRPGATAPAAAFRPPMPPPGISAMGSVRAAPI